MSNPFYSIELRNTSFQLIKLITKEVKKLTWEFDNIGGCGRSTLTLPVDSNTLDDFMAPDVDLQIRLPNETDTGANVVYRGYAESHKPRTGKPDSISIEFFGYVGQLKRVRVNKTYTNEDVNDIIKDILNTFVVPDTNITFNESDISAPNFLVDTITFDTLADSAIRTIAELAGAVVWGVDVNRNFYFKTRIDIVNHYVRFPKDIDKYDAINDYSQIINRLIIKGGNDFEETVNNTESQAFYGLRTLITSNSSITTSSVAQQYGSTILLSKAVINVRSNVKLIDNRKFFEESIPLGKINLLDKTVAQAKRYNDDDAIYGNFIYGGQPSFFINKIKYQLAGSGTNVTMNLGLIRPDISNDIKRLNFEIEQLRNT